MSHISADSHSQASGKGFEDAFYLVVLVLPFCLDVEVHGCAVAEALEEVEEHLCRHLAHLFPMELGIPHEPRPSAEVECHLAKAVVHGQTVAVALYATLVAERLADAFAQSQCHILDGMVFIDMEVAIATDVEVGHAVLGYLFEHVVEEAKSRLDVCFSVAVQVDAHLDVRFLCSTFHALYALSCKDKLGNLLPVHVVAQDETTASEVLCQLGIGGSVADDEASLQVVSVCHVVGKHGCSGLTSGKMVFGKTAVNVDSVEGDALALQNVEH